MVIQTRIFGEITIEDDKLIHFEKGIIGFPDLKDFALVHDAEQGSNVGIRWMQSVQEPQFAIPVMDPLLVREDYNPVIEDELLQPLGEWKPEELLVLVSVTIPSDLKKMTVNLMAPFIINAESKKACQIIVDNGDYAIKYPIYDILQEKKAGE